MLGLANVRSWKFFHLRFHPSRYFFFFIWHGGKRETNLKIRWSKIYLDSLLSKTTKCSNVVNQMKTKKEVSNDQIQVRL